MAEFQFKCPQCHVDVTADDSMRGEVAACPSCGKGIVIPRLRNNRLGVRRDPVLEAQVNDAGSQLPSPPMPSRFQELEREVAEDRRRARIGKVLGLLKNLLVILVLLVVGYFSWGLLTGKFKVPFTASATMMADSRSTDAGSSLQTTGDQVIPMVSSGGRGLDFESCRDKLIVIGNEGMRSGGSGFLVKMGGKKYFVTNEHVTRGPEKWFERICMIDGRELRLGKFEVAIDQDIVRFEVDDALPSFELSSVVPKMNEQICIYGNSAGGGAATSISGTVRAVGPFRIEVDAEAVAGNSGSPVLGEDGKVLGIFTYVTNEKNDRDWGKEGTRFNGVRRWAVRFTALEWVSVDWSEYRRQVAGLSDIVNYIRRLVPFVAVANEDYDESGFTYGLKYGVQDNRIFSTYEEEFRSHLIKLSLTYDRINGYGAWGGARGSRRPRKRDEIEFSRNLCDALEAAAKVLDGTNWVAPQFKSDMTDFCPMRWYRDLLDKAMSARIQTLEDLAKGGRGGMDAVYEEAKTCIGIVQAGDSCGSGFIAELDGRKYFITNEHVVRGGNPFSARTPSGMILKFKSFELAENEDLVRMELVGDVPDAIKVNLDDPAPNSRIYVFGNSDGGGVITHESGRVAAIGPDRLEIQAAFVQGNSGSAVLNEAGEAIGVATYATLRNDPENWVKEGTRYNGVRRFAVRLGHVKWKKMPWEEYVKFASGVEECERYVNLCREVCFRNRKLLHGYEIKEMIADGKVTQGAFVMALTNVGRADDELTSLVDLYEKLRAKASTTKKGALEDPRDKLRRVVRNYPVVRQKCTQARLSVLKTGLQFVNGLKTQTGRQEEDVKPLRRFFEHHIRRFREFYKDDLLGPTRLTMP